MIKPTDDQALTADGASSSRARSGGVRATIALPSESEHRSNPTARLGLDNTVHRSKATSRSAGQDKPNSEMELKTSTSTSTKKKGEDDPSRKSRIPQAQGKRRMGMKEESWKGSR